MPLLCEITTHGAASCQVFRPESDLDANSGIVAIKAAKAFKDASADPSARQAVIHIPQADGYLRICVALQPPGNRPSGEEVLKRAHRMVFPVARPPEITASICFVGYGELTLCRQVFPPF